LTQRHTPPSVEVKFVARNHKELYCTIQYEI
jgi:hypothetical protein